MREVLPELMRWWRAGETVGVGTVVAHLPLRAAAGRGVDAGRPGRRGRRLGLRRLRRGRGLRARPGGRRLRACPVLQRYGVSDDDAFAVGPDLRRHPRRLRRDRSTSRPSPSSARWPTTSRPGARSRSPRSSSTPTPAWVGRRLVVRPEDADGGRSTGSLGSDARRRRRHRRRPRAARRRAAPRRSPTAPTASAAARACGSSCRRFAPRPRMLVFGAIDFAAAVAHQSGTSSATR